jgi:beta-lactamase superfamily II metal-dependent hydrolase
VIFKVGSGDSSLIVFPTGKTMLIDTGVSARTDDTVIPFLQRHGITRLDYFMGTHIHPDHTGGIPNLEAGGFIDEATKVWDWNSFDYEDEFDIEGTHWFIYNARDKEIWGTDANLNSISYRFEYNGFVYSGTGDEGTGSMKRFMNDHPDLVQAHVRNTAHHMWGPVSKPFLIATDAYLYMVSCSTEVKSEKSYKRSFLSAMSTLQNNGGRDTEHALTGDVGNIYIRASSGTDWDYAFYSQSKAHVISDF